MSDVEPTYHGEVLLLRWADSSTQGRTVTFIIEDGPDAPTRHPFHGLKTGREYGQRFAIVAVPLAEDQHPEGDAGKTTERQKKEQHPLVQQAGILCADRRFIDWASGFTDHSGLRTTEATTAWLRGRCGISSRREIATNREAAAKFEALVARYRAKTGLQAECR